MGSEVSISKTCRIGFGDTGQSKKQRPRSQVWSSSQWHAARLHPCTLPTTNVVLMTVASYVAPMAFARKAVIQALEHTLRYERAHQNLCQCTSTIVCPDSWCVFLSAGTYPGVGPDGRWKHVCC